MKRTAMIVVGIVVAVAVGAAILVRRSRQALRFPYLAAALTEERYRALASRPGWQAHALDVGNQTLLRGLVRAPRKPDSPWLLFFTGNSATSLEDGQRCLAGLAEPDDLGAAVFAYRGYDGNPGKPSPDALQSDGLLAYAEVANKLGAKKIHVVGFSLGSTLAAFVAAHASQPKPSSLTLLAPTTELDMGKKTDLFLHRYETLKYLPEISSKTLVVHGTKDATLPVDGARTIVKQLGERGQFVEPPELGHFDLCEAPAVAELVRRFVAERSGSSGPAAP